MNRYQLGKALICGALALATAALATPTAHAAAGLNFEDQVILRDGAANNDDGNEYVRVAVDGDVAIAVWQTLNSSLTWDVFYSRSTDDGATWSPEVNLSNQGISAGNNDLDPRPLFKNGELMITWQNGDTNSGDLYYAHTNNFTTAPNTAAITFTSGIVYAGVGTEETGAMAAADDSGNWVVVFEGETTAPANVDDSYDIFATVSSDDGVTWSAPVVVNNDANDNGEDGDCRVTWGAGNFVAIWKSESDMGGTVGTDEDVFIAASPNGMTWSAAPVAIHPWAATDDADDDNPMISFVNNKFVACFQSGFDDGSVGDDEDIVVSVADSSDLSAWTATFVNDATEDEADDEDPWVAGSGNGTAMVVWSSEEDGDYDIEGAWSTDMTAWTMGDAPLNSGGVGEDDDDEKPGIAGGDRATFYVSWPPDEKDAALAKTVNPAASLSITGQASIEVGQDLTLTANTTGFIAPFNGQWIKDGVDLSGETGNVLSIPVVNLSDAGAYQFRMTDSSKAIFLSPAFTVTVAQQLPLSALPMLPLIALAGAAVISRRRK